REIRLKRKYLPLPKGSQSTELFITIILTTKGGQENEWIQKQFTERPGLALPACRRAGRYSGSQWTLDGSGRSMATGCLHSSPDRLATVCPEKG
nr:hypothetical protein [Bacillus paranthracis]